MATTQDRTGLLDMMGQGDSAFAGWLDPRRNFLQQTFAGMVGHDSAREAMRGAVQGATQGRQQDTQYGLLMEDRAREQQQLQQQEQQRNATLEYLQRSHPDLAQAVQGGLPIADAWRESFSRREGAGGGSGGTMGLTPIWGTDESGNPILGQMSNQGGIIPVDMPEGMTFGKEPIRLDAGNQFVLLDPVTRQQIGTIPKSGDVPTGYETQSNGGIAPMPGSPQEAEQIQGRNKATSAMNTLEQKHQIVSTQLDRALNNANFFTTGIVGSIGSAVPGTPAYDLARTLDTIKANIGFEELQTMRDNSPTGGALGQVTERELAFLQSTIANIEQAQSEAQLRENLILLRDYMSMSQNQRRQAFQQQYGAGSPTGPAATGGQPSGGGVVDYSDYF